MPPIKFVLIRCRCGAEYRVRLEKVAAREAFECLTCGQAVEVAAWASGVAVLHELSAKVVAAEEVFVLDLETQTAIPRHGDPRRKLVNL